MKSRERNVPAPLLTIYIYRIFYTKQNNDTFTAFRNVSFLPTHVTNTSKELKRIIILMATATIFIFTKDSVSSE